MNPAMVSTVNATRAKTAASESSQTCTISAV